MNRRSLQRWLSTRHRARDLPARLTQRPLLSEDPRHTAASRRTVTPMTAPPN